MQRARLLAKLASRAAKQTSATYQSSRALPVLVVRDEAGFCMVGNSKEIGSHFFHSSAESAGAALLQTEPLTEGIVFPREGPGLSYALNWALAAGGVTPSGEAYRNLKPATLKEHGAALPGAKTGTPVYAKGSGALSKAQFNRLFKEVTSHLSRSGKLYVHDGAVGSSPSCDARTRTISDIPAGALAFSAILTPAPTRSVAADAFPLTVYVATGYSPSVLDKGGFVAVDFDASAVLVVGGALGDAAAIKSALAASAAPLSLAAGALPLPGRLVVKGDSSALVLAPGKLDGLVSSSVGSSAVSPDAGVVWNGKGVARLFQTKSAAEPNLYKAPSSLVLLTSDSTGAIPSISKLSPSQAAYYFLAGYDGEGFKPAYVAGPSASEPLSMAQKLADLLTAGDVPAFLINISDGASLISGKELEKLVEASLSQKLPKSKSKKPAENAVESLRAKFDEFVKSTFPEVPEGIAP